MLCERYLINFKCKKSTSYANMYTCVLRMYTSECLHVNIYTNKRVREVRNISSCGTVALMVLGQFSDICGYGGNRSPYGPWPVFWYLRIWWSANIRKLAKDHKGYGSAAKTSHEHFAMSSNRQNNSARCYEKVDKLQSKWTSWLLNVDKSKKN